MNGFMRSVSSRGKGCAPSPCGKRGAGRRFGISDCLISAVNTAGPKAIVTYALHKQRGPCSRLRPGPIVRSVSLDGTVDPSFKRLREELFRGDLTAGLDDSSDDRGASRSDVRGVVI